MAKSYKKTKPNITNQLSWKRSVIIQSPDMTNEAGEANEAKTSINCSEVGRRHIEINKEDMVNDDDTTTEITAVPKMVGCPNIKMNDKQQSTINQVKEDSEIKNKTNNNSNDCRHNQLINRPACNVYSNWRRSIIYQKTTSSFIYYFCRKTYRRCCFFSLLCIGRLSFSWKPYEKRMQLVAEIIHGYNTIMIEQRRGCC